MHRITFHRLVIQDKIKIIIQFKGYIIIFIKIYKIIWSTTTDNFLKNNWNEEFDYSTNEGGIKTSQKVGLNENEWKQIQVKKTMKFPNTTKLGVRFENRKPGSTIYWDDVSLRKVESNTDTVTDAFRYDLFVKKYDAGLDRIILTSKSSMQ